MNKNNQVKLNNVNNNIENSFENNDQIGKMDNLIKTADSGENAKEEFVSIKRKDKEKMKN